MTINNSQQQETDAAQVHRVRIEALLVGLVVAAILLAGEFGVFAIQTWQGQNGVTFARPEIWLDAAVPFVPELVWPYWLYYIIIYMVTWVPRTRSELIQIVGGLLAINVVAWVIYVAYPTVMDRPPLNCGESISCGFVGAVYLIDPGYAVLPSLHVANSLYVAYCFYRWKHALRHVVGIFAVLIIAASALVKQHYILDLFAGLILAPAAGYVGWRIADHLWHNGFNGSITAIRHARWVRSHRHSAEHP